MPKKKGIRKIAQSLGVKMYDAGRKLSTGVVKEASPTEVMKPSLYLHTEQLPTLKGGEVGNKVTIIAEGEISSHSINENTPNKKRETFDIRIDRLGLKKIANALKG